ncbi:MAG: hypothetical protein CBC57_01535 [Euryarchaeota archaeon TMED97]|nr:MAG: hypothetical protein CBC57_01535 [Euryarchaeota archaeon TMED97]
MRKQNYLDNKDMLKEIHKSKLSYCYVLDDEYSRFDTIVESVDDIKLPEVVQTAKENRARQLSTQAYESAYLEWYDNTSRKQSQKPKQINFKIDPDTIDEKTLVFRVMTFDHVPLEPGRKNKPKTVADHHSKCNFPPFKHYAYVNNNDEVKECLRSHWEGGLDNGKFNTQHGTITNNLAKMYIKLCERYSMRSNWRGYTYVDEMRSHALLQLSQIGLQFNELKSENPFAYYTAAVTNSFTRVLNLEKRNQNIRDDLLQEAGQMPSWTRQIEHEMAERAKWDEKSDKERKEHGFNI